ncbi:MAG TPA: heme exporter protein CcmD [Rhizomicrobium sp.]|nr:heme exporter protein CcmD [Rhizomicrobium sp.]
MLLHFLAMGGYAAFVWPAYAASFVGIGAIAWTTVRDYARAKRRLKQIDAEVRR